MARIGIANLQNGLPGNFDSARRTRNHVAVFSPIEHRGNDRTRRFGLCAANLLGRTARPPKVRLPPSGLPRNGLPVLLGGFLVNGMLAEPLGE
jgi:hypothetical protein